MQDKPTQLYPRIGLSHGDLNGIGYEIILKTFADARMLESLTPVLYGQSKAFSYYKKNFGFDSPNYSLTRDARQAGDKKFNIVNILESEVKIEPGTPTDVSVEMSVLSMKRATSDLNDGSVDALVMAPDSPVVAKSNLDYLLSFHKEAKPLRVMVNDLMRIGLATDDMPLTDALGLLNVPYLVSKLTVFAQALSTDFGLNAPKIAVMGLNPHPDNDDQVVAAVGEAKSKDIFAFGPFSPTQLFATGLWKKYDAVMALHYEQGIMPLRLMTTGGCASYWAGLPVVCAAPLHGPAFDIANTNQAVPDDYRKAVFLAADIVNSRKSI
jgi:4-hydroxythreonine-4-phosphate dehydrogenase